MLNNNTSSEPVGINSTSNIITICKFNRRTSPNQLLILFLKKTSDYRRCTRENLVTSYHLMNHTLQKKKFTNEVDNHTRIGRDLPAPLQLSLHTTQFPTYARRVTQRVARTVDQRSTIPKTTGSNGGGRGREPEART